MTVKPLLVVAGLAVFLAIVRAVFGQSFIGMAIFFAAVLLVGSSGPKVRRLLTALGGGVIAAGIYTVLIRLLGL